ncbi:hypothetical protein A2U01_0040575, partial [Trifolium medium]|nr:hypothetical protein [Trifolium medium]
YDRLVAFVGAFPANLLEDSEGNPLLDDNGQQKTYAKLVDTKRLLGYKTPEEVASFWRDMTSVQARLRASNNAKKKTSETVYAGTPSGLGFTLEFLPSFSFFHQRSGMPSSLMVRLSWSLRSLRRQFWKTWGRSPSRMRSPTPPWPL